DPHALLALENSAIGNVAARAIPHAGSGIFGERSEQLIENLVLAKEAHALDGPLPHASVLIVTGIICEHAVDAFVVDAAAREHAEIVDCPCSALRVGAGALNQQ